MFSNLMNTANNRDAQLSTNTGQRSRLKILLSLCLCLPMLGLLGLPPANASGPVGQPTLPPSPLAPSTPNAVHNGSTQVTLTWTDRSTNELVFGVQYRDHGGAWKNAPSVPSTSISTTGKTYTTTHTVPYGTIFCYHISAGNLGGVNYSPAACAVPAAPGKPTALRSGSYSETYGDQRNLVYFNRSAVWEWGYRLYTRRQDSTGWVFNSELVSGPPTSATEQMRAINLPENGTYCLRVVAFNSRGVSEATTEDVCISTTPIIE